MLKRVLATILNLVIAACGAHYSLSASVHAQAQEATRVREVRTSPAEVTVTLNEQFFNSLLETIFKSLKAPTFPLSLTRGDQQRSAPSGSFSATRSTSTSSAFASTLVSTPSALTASAFSLSHATFVPDACESAVTLEPEASGVRTAVRFESGRIVAPLAFKGTYSVALLGCLYFRGWADTVINLSFDRQRQVLSAHVTVVDIHLDNIPSLASGIVIRLVQNSLDSRINPIEILQAAQLSTRVPVAGSGGALRMRATEIRPEVVQGALSLHIFYEFAPAE